MQLLKHLIMLLYIICSLTYITIILDFKDGCDITENQAPWQCKNDFTWEYRQDVIRYEKYLNKMIWVKGHNGNKWNEYTDELATD